jgi:hypothetical protein
MNRKNKERLLDKNRQIRSHLGGFLSTGKRLLSLLCVDSSPKEQGVGLQRNEEYAPAKIPP